MAFVMFTVLYWRVIRPQAQASFTYLILSQVGGQRGPLPLHLSQKRSKKIIALGEHFIFVCFPGATLRSDLFLL